MGAAGLRKGCWQWDENQKQAPLLTFCVVSSALSLIALGLGWIRKHQEEVQFFFFYKKSKNAFDSNNPTTSVLRKEAWMRSKNILGSIFASIMDLSK